MRYHLCTIFFTFFVASIVSAAELPANGALIYTENGSCLVSTYTNSTYSHVAIVLYERGNAVVFEAKPGGVTKSTYQQYLKTAATAKLNDGNPVTLWLMNPKHAYNKQDLTSMLDAANQAIGTPYSVIPTITGRSQSTLQCAQYVSSILQTTPRFWFKSPKYQTPATLLNIAKPGYHPMSLLQRSPVSTPSFMQKFSSFFK